MLLYCSRKCASRQLYFVLFSLHMKVIINGYGVPTDITTDLNYNSYLGQIFNYLWERHHDQPLTIILTGGRTDLTPPYRRTEAGEMARWFRPRIKQRKLKNWKILTLASGISAVDNILALQKIISTSQAIYICEYTRRPKMTRLVRAAFGTHVKLLAIDFDTSPTRYDTKQRKKLEREDLTYSLRALRDSTYRQKLTAANKERLRRLRMLSLAERARSIDRVTREVRQKFLT